ncbi:bifunctional DNA primase/polymerase [Streptomyces sp. NPDC055078]
MHHIPPGSLPFAALAAAERGWRVFPLVHGAKRPAIRSWEERATAEPNRISRCWSTGDYNLGVATGPSRLLVVDLDVPKHDQDVPPAGTPAGVADGADALALLAERHGRLAPADTYTVRTASGGTHLYFVAPDDVELRNSAGSLGWKIDTRANGGYVVGTGSVVGDRQYTVVRETAPAPLPEWLTKLLVPAPLPPQRLVTVPLVAHDRRSAYLRAAVEGELRRVSAAPQGHRNDALYQASVALGQLVAGGELSGADVTGWLTDAAVGNSLTDVEARGTIASGLRAGAKRPRNVGRRAA